MKKVISASRRTDLIAFFPEDFSQMLGEEKARVMGPYGNVYSVDLSAENVHTLVLWSKNFENLIQNRHRLRDRLEKYDQLYLHFTITGLGGSFIERGVPNPGRSLPQLEELLKIVGRAERISVRFDPVVFWDEKGKIQSNLHFFSQLASSLASLGIGTVRFSFAQWYSKSKKRAEKSGFIYVDPPVEEKTKETAALVSIARYWNVQLYSCSQNFLTEVEGVQASSCIDGIVLQDLHPHKKEASARKDKSQRPECGCTESIDIGSYIQSCPHRCLYCYANPKI